MSNQPHVYVSSTRTRIRSPGLPDPVPEEPAHVGALTQLGKGAIHRRKAISLNALGTLPVPFPPFPEQRRIAAILDHADALGAKSRQVLAHLDALTQSIFHDMFGDSSKNPKTLPLRKLAELGRLDRGVSKHRPRNDPSLLGGPSPLIQTGDVARSDGYIREYSSTYSALGLAQSKIWPAGTLCITIAANIGKVGILTFVACFPDSVVGFTSDPETVEYIRVWPTLRQPAIFSCTIIAWVSICYTASPSLTSSFKSGPMRPRLGMTCRSCRSHVAVGPL